MRGLRRRAGTGLGRFGPCQRLASARRPSGRRSRSRGRGMPEVRVRDSPETAAKTRWGSGHFRRMAGPAVAARTEEPTSRSQAESTSSFGGTIRRKWPLGVLQIYRFCQVTGVALPSAGSDQAPSPVTKPSHRAQSSSAERRAPSPARATTPDSRKLVQPLRFRGTPTPAGSTNFQIAMKRYSFAAPYIPVVRITGSLRRPPDAST
jgi:hypothetical protein